MITYFKYCFPTCSLLLLLFLAQSCEKQVLKPEISSPQPALLEANNFGQSIASNCNNYLNQGLSFPLDIETNSSDSDQGGTIVEGYLYNVFLGRTPPFNISTDCVCIVRRYTLQFDDLSQLLSYSIVDAAGVAVPATVNYHNNTILIAASHVGINLSIGFVPLPGHTAPALLSADGFCIVDNVSTPSGGFVSQEAYIEHAFDPIGQNPTRKVYVPVSVSNRFAQTAP